MNLNNKTIDILLATYNGEKFLKYQIESILNQSYKNIRLIISDDCSSDNTINIINEFISIDERIVLYIQEKNIGSTLNFEYLISKVENDFFMLCDQDDIWNNDKIEKEFNLLVKEDSDLVFSDLEIVDEDLNLIHKSFNDQMKLSRKIKEQINKPELCYLYNVITGCTIIAKASIINSFLPIPKCKKYIIHDSWISVCASQKFKVSYLNEATLKYRQHNGNQIGIEKLSPKLKSFDEIRNLLINVKLELFETYLSNNNVFEEKYKMINKMSFDYFKMIKRKKYINISKLRVFHKLYKNESLSYYLLNFMILNLPILGRFAFKIRKLVKK